MRVCARSSLILQFWPTDRPTDKRPGGKRTHGANYNIVSASAPRLPTYSLTNYARNRLGRDRRFRKCYAVQIARRPDRTSASTSLLVDATPRTAPCRLLQRENSLPSEHTCRKHRTRASTVLLFDAAMTCHAAILLPQVMTYLR